MQRCIITKYCLISHELICWSMRHVLQFHLCTCCDSLWLLLAHHVCMLWTLLLAIIKGQAQCAAIVCLCVWKGMGPRGGGQRGRNENALTEGLRFFKKSVGSVASVHRIQFVHSFAGLLSVPLERSSTKWKFPSWNTRGSAGVTVQVSSLMNCVCRQHVTKYLKKS